MNPFTTEYPLNSQPSWFDARAHPLRAFIGRILGLALGLAPFILCGLYCWLIEAEDGMTTPEPLSAAEFWRFLWMAGAFAFGFSLVISLLTVAGYRFAVRQWRQLVATSSCQE